METVSVDKDRCTLCGLCIPVCVRGVLVEGAETMRVTDPALCNLCGHCKAVCPEDAPRLPSLNAEEFSPAPNADNLPKPDQLVALFRSRRSTRIYQRRAVEREKLERVLQAGRFAPSGGNRQPLRYVVLQSQERIATVREIAISALGKRAGRIQEEMERKREGGEVLSMTDQALQTYAGIWLSMLDLLKQGIDRLFYHAPAVVICHGSPATATLEVDAGLAAMQMVLMAEAIGLGTCFCHFLVFAIEESPELRQALQIPEDNKVVVSFMTGYPDVSFTQLVARNPLEVNWL